jgi:hypothetical protein
MSRLRPWLSADFRNAHRASVRARLRQIGSCLVAALMMESEVGRYTVNAQIARQQSKQRKVRVAAPKAVTAANRRQAIGSLVRCLETNHSQKEWIKAIDSVLLGRWPNIMTMPSVEQESALEELCTIVEEARAIVRAKLSPEQLLPNHQAAVYSLFELSAAADPPERPFDQVPALFRAAVEQDKAAGTRNPYPVETDLIELALMLIDRNGGDANIRTPEQEEFYAGLAFPLDSRETARVRYSPENVTIH